MIYIASLVFLVSIYCLIVGYFSPTVFNFLLFGQSSRLKVLLIFGLPFIVTAVVVGNYILQTSKLSPTLKNSSQPQVATINEKNKIVSYSIISKDVVGNGINSVAMVDSRLSNIDDMSTIGKKLKEEFKNERSVFIAIFDDKKAAGMKSVIAQKSKQEKTFYFNHYVGEYIKNEEDHQLVIHLKGPDTKEGRKVFSY